MIAKKLLICTDQQYSTRLLKFGLAAAGEAGQEGQGSELAESGTKGTWGLRDALTRACRGWH